MLLSLFAVFLSVLIFFKFVSPCTYWKEKGVKHAQAWPFIGSMGRVFFKKQPYVEFLTELYNKFPNERYVGFMKFTQNHILIRDIELIGKITGKEFNFFTDRTVSSRLRKDKILSQSLISLTGDHWRDMRATLSPAFTSNRTRNLYTFIETCARNFVNHYKAEVEIEVKEVFAKFANDVIASVAFSTELNSLKEPNDFYTNASQLKPDFFKQFITTSDKNRQDLISLLKDESLKFETYKRAKGEGFAIGEEPQIDPLSRKIQLTDEQILAQALLFFLTGFETISTSASFLAYELAVNLDVQKKLQREIDKVVQITGDRIPYDALLSMKYLDQVISESLRKWPPKFETDRVCTRDYHIKAQKGEKSLLIRKGMSVVIPIMAIHRDPDYYPNPNRFDPERFSDENRDKVVPGTYLPFGAGPRNCLGARLALLEMKTVFGYLLAKFDIVQAKKTQMPIKLSAKCLDMEPEEGFWLGFRPRN
ncbi:cytochrome P450 CYP9AF1 precursor [Tribolium castaneum]|nr:cytochrome P450 CYP9AF1 precursor [Tribolium castaneum]|eukprot:NP_001123893.1 cytochrome P450 CYP9AF1 precursor [Tribolium castaneum]